MPCTRIRRVLIAVLVATFVPLTPMLASSGEEEEARSGDREVLTVPVGTVIDTDYFAAAERVEISGVVNGDVYAAGAQILVDGTINGDLLAAGGTITISGTISQDARLVGGEISLDGKIGKNLTLAGGSIELAKAAVLQGGLVAAGGNVRVSAPVGGDVRLAAGNVTISEQIAGDVHAAVGVLRLTSHARVAGDLAYWSEATASIDPNAQIAGQVRKGEWPEELRPSAARLLGALVMVKLLLSLTSFVSTLVLGLLLMRFYPNATHRAVTHLKERPLAVLGLGVLALILTPIAAVVLAGTVVGLPLAVILLAWFAVTLYLGRIFVIHWAGLAVFTWVGKAAYEKWAFTAALVLYSLIALIPFLGDLVVSFVVLFGLGSTLLVKQHVYLAARQHAML